MAESRSKTCSRGKEGGKITMPFYEYQCESCKHKMDEYQEVNDAHLEICPKCKKKSLKRLISLSFGYTGLTNTNAREYYENKIKPEAKRIAERIKNGDEDAAADIFGENKIGG
jgi:putative FmdB family regulatory protein